MLFEDPLAYLRRSKDGREVFCQTLTTTLLVGGTYPKWGTRNTLTEQGAGFFKALDRLSFGTSSWPTAPVFIDEITMPKRHDDELSASPDWTLLFDDRVWIIELKTEPGSHRTNQIPHYIDLACHHYPGRAIDITYLTGPLVKPAPELRTGQRYVHLTWEDVLPLYNQAWGATEDPRVRGYLEVVQEALSALATPWTEWRNAFTGTPAPAEIPRDPLTEALGIVDATAKDHAQRALDYPAQGAQELHDLRLEIRNLIRLEAPESARHHVRPWVWRPESLGQPLTTAGREHGLELRFSYYAVPAQ
ncbi:MAG TPA: hypothetical protein VFJ22_08565 [Dermatophilaceae bacterium]|nr:hypothetical protein [Dermatophilaceae bacterium]